MPNPLLLINKTRCKHVVMAALNKRYLLAILILILRRRRRRRRRLLAVRSAPTFWCRDIFLKREELGEFHTLLQEMGRTDRESFFR